MSAIDTANDSVNGNKSRDSGQNKDSGAARLNELYALISHHADLYYNEDRLEIEDSEYDSLVRELKQLEEAFPDLARKDFLTHRVGGQASDLFSKVKHTVPMLSLDNVFNPTELKAFFGRIAAHDVGFTCELKIDGLPYGKITIIEGDGGDGKTTMILTIAAMLSQGIAPPTLERGHLLPSATTEPITTFYLTTEDEVADTSLVLFIRAGGDTHRFAYSAEIKHHMTLVEDELLAAIEESKCRLFIIDPYKAFLPEGTNMGSVTKMRTVFTALSNIAKKNGSGYCSGWPFE